MTSTFFHCDKCGAEFTEGQIKHGTSLGLYRLTLRIEPIGPSNNYYCDPKNWRVEEWCLSCMRKYALLPLGWPHKPGELPPHLQRALHMDEMVEMLKPKEDLPCQPTS